MYSHQSQYLNSCQFPLSVSSNLDAKFRFWILDTDLLQTREGSLYTTWPMSLMEISLMWVGIGQAQMTTTPS